MQVLFVSSRANEVFFPIHSSPTTDWELNWSFGWALTPWWLLMPSNVQTQAVVFPSVGALHWDSLPKHHLFWRNLFDHNFYCCLRQIWLKLANRERNRLVEVIWETQDSHCQGQWELISLFSFRSQAKNSRKQDNSSSTTDNNIQHALFNLLSAKYCHSLTASASSTTKWAPISRH